MGGGFFLRCMGYPGLYGADGRPYKLKVRKHLALLVYLALEDHAQRRRDTLVELLWSGAAPECGRHSLSMALSVLRGVLGAGAGRVSCPPSTSGTRRGSCTGATASRRPPSRCSRRGSSPSPTRPAARA